MRPPVAIACLCAFLGLGSVMPAAGQQNPYRLKDADEKKLCLACHTDFEQTLKKASVHTPVKAGECSGCHDPHVSSHDKLLPRKKGRSAWSATRQRVGKARSRHKAVAEGACEKCHDPHASDNPNNLIGRGNDLCVGCHKELGESIKTAKFRHDPVERGCLTCHAAHGSDQSQHLLKTAEPSLCLGCHKPGTPAFQSRHQNYPVAKATCTSCHDPRVESSGAAAERRAPAGRSRGVQPLPRGADLAQPVRDEASGLRALPDLPQRSRRGDVLEAPPPLAGRPAAGLRQLPQPACLALPEARARPGREPVPRVPRRHRGAAVDHRREARASGRGYVRRVSLAPRLRRGSPGHAAHGGRGLLDLPRLPEALRAPDRREGGGPTEQEPPRELPELPQGARHPFKRMLLAETTSELCTRCHKKYAR